MNFADAMKKLAEKPKGKRRVLTIVLHVVDDVAVKKVYDAHMNNSLLHGCLVGTIANGDLAKKAEEMESAWEMACERLDEYDIKRIKKDMKIDE